MRRGRPWAVATAVSVGLLLSRVGLGARLHVPADYPTIQVCIDAAVSGSDECVVAPGTYRETINFLGKAITLRSSGGADVTTIDATGTGGSVVTCASGEGPDTVLDGFTITGSTPTYTPQVGTYAGGGMYNLYSSPTVTNCTFTNNYVGSFSPPYRDALGGGMCNSYSSPMVTHCTFKNNAAFPSPVDHPGLGGGMYNDYESNPIVTHCVFLGNRADDGGGMYNFILARPRVTYCTFYGNVAHWGGGGMYNLSGRPSVTNCVFAGNSAMFGGGLLNDGTFFTTGFGTIVADSTFAGNRSRAGGAIYNDFVSNPLLLGCVLWGNTPDEVQNDGSSAPTLRWNNTQGGLPVGSVDGGGNIDLAPMFVRQPDPGPDGEWDGVDDDYGDLRLRPESPCINAGDPNFVPQPGQTDLDGHARVLCGRVDMGAYEFGIGDYDCDRAANLVDFAQWNACVTGPRSGGSADPPYAAGCAAFDFDGDGDVDLGDFAEFEFVMEP